MTNGEKYKTAQERANAFRKFCESHDRVCAGCPLDCNTRRSRDESMFAWLDLEKENSELRECLKEAADLECTSRGCLSFRDKTCHGTYGCGIVKKWSAALEGGNRAND